MQVNPINKDKALEIVVNGSLVSGEISAASLRDFENEACLEALVEKEPLYIEVRFKKYTVRVKPKLIWYYVISDIGEREEE